jgi:hypothetical protein
MRVNAHIWLESDLVSTTTYTNSYQLRHIVGYSASIGYTPSTGFSGQLALEASNDGTIWSEIVCISIDDSKTSHIFNVPDVFYQYTRLKIVPTVGTLSNVIVHMYSKGF